MEPAAVPNARPVMVVGDVLSTGDDRNHKLLWETLGIAHVLAGRGAPHQPTPLTRSPTWLHRPVLCRHQALPVHVLFQVLQSDELIVLQSASQIMASSPSIGDSVASSDGSLSERLMGKWSKWSGTVPLLPPDSPVMVRVIALDRLVCIYRRLSLMLVCTPHGIIGIVLSQFWIWRAHANGAPAGTLYFDRMSMLRGWLVKAQQLRRGMKLANICGLIMILIKFSLLVVMLVAFKVKKEVRDMASSNLFAMFIVFIVIALTTLLDFAHFVAGALFVSPAVIRFLDAATPTIETSLLTDGEIETLRVACNTANLAADELGMERFMGAPNELMTGKAIEAVKGLHSFLCVPELELLKGLRDA